MLFAIMGFFKQKIYTNPVELQPALNEHLGQPGLDIRFADLLKDRHGNRAGLIVCLEANNFVAADAYLKQSPFVDRDMYQRVEVLELCIEVGAGELWKSEKLTSR